MINHSDLIARLRNTRLLSQRNQMELQGEAATAIEALTAENARLREAGRLYIEYADCDMALYARAINAARTALQESGQ